MADLAKLVSYLLSSSAAARRAIQPSATAHSAGCVAFFCRSDAALHELRREITSAASRLGLSREVSFKVGYAHPHTVHTSASSESYEIPASLEANLMDLYPGTCVSNSHDCASGFRSASADLKVRHGDVCSMAARHALDIAAPSSAAASGRGCSGLPNRTPTPTPTSAPLALVPPLRAPAASAARTVGSYAIHPALWDPEKKFCFNREGILSLFNPMPAGAVSSQTLLGLGKSMLNAPAGHPAGVLYSRCYCSSSNNNAPPPAPPAPRGATFLVDIMNGMVFTEEDERLLRKAVYAKCKKPRPISVEDFFRLEEKVDRLAETTERGLAEVIKLLSKRKTEWGSVKFRGRTMDLSKLYAFVSACVKWLISFMSGGVM